METKFQTSFIPKRPLTTTGGAIANVNLAQARPRRHNSIFLNIAILLFVVSLGAAGGIYAWKSILLSNQESYKQQLSDRQRQFNPALIQQLKEENIKIDAASQIIANHIAISNIFDVISRLTTQNVRFVSLDVTAPTDKSSGLKISLSGYGANLPSVAFQSDVLNALEQVGLKTVVKNPMVSDPSIGDSGVVSFGFTATLDPNAISYSKTLSGVPINDSSNSTSSTIQ